MLIGVRLRSGSGIPNVDFSVAIRKSQRARQLHPAGQREPVDGGNDGLEGLRRPVQAALPARGRLPTPVVWSRSVISFRSAPGAERPAARPGQDGHQDVVVAVDFLEAS